MGSLGPSALRGLSDHGTGSRSGLCKNIKQKGERVKGDRHIPQDKNCAQDCGLLGKSRGKPAVNVLDSQLVPK